MNPTLYHRSPWMTITLAEAAAGGASPAGGAPKGGRADILINGPIGQWDYSADTRKEASRLLKEEVRKELSALAYLNVQEITVEITSLGGSFQHAVAIHDYLAQFPGKVVTRVIGMTASAATVVAQAGRVRQISANALYLIHRAGPPYGVASAANAVELRAAADGYETLDRRMSAIYAKRSGKAEAAVWEIMNEDNGNGRWMNADQAKERGLVDEVFEPMDAAASAEPPDAALLSSAHLPPLPGPVVAAAARGTSPVAAGTGPASVGAAPRVSLPAACSATPQTPPARSEGLTMAELVAAAGTPDVMAAEYRRAAVEATPATRHPHSMKGSRPMNLRETLDNPATVASVDPKALAQASPLLGAYATLRKREGMSHAEAVAWMHQLDPNCNINADLEKFDLLTASADTAR